MSALHLAVKDSELKAEEALSLIKTMDGVLALKIESEAAKLRSAAVVKTHEGDAEAAEIDALVAERTAAKKAKDFAKADKIRGDLASRGIVITDTPEGPVWKRTAKQP